MAFDPQGFTRSIPRSDAQPLRRLTLIVASVGAIMLLSLGIDHTLRPTLLPDEVPERELRSYGSSRVIDRTGHSGCGGDEDRDHYDVNRALVSDEPMDGEPEPEGTGPARRRYVRPDPHAIISGGVVRGTTRLVGPAGPAISGRSRLLRRAP